MAGKDLCLFDVDGTLTLSRLPINPEMKVFLSELHKKVAIGLVGGSDLEKIREQMLDQNLEEAYDYVFAQNGLVAYKDGKLIGKESILEHMGEEKLQPFINFCLGYMSKLYLPAKRGNFVEFRSGLINICPVGRSCTQKEREEFAAYDKVHKIREQFIEAVQKKFPDLGLIYTIGGQISFDCFPTGWDKTFCLKHINRDAYSGIHFFGDKTFPGGNDYELFNHEAVIGHTVTSPEDTMEQLKEMYFS
ncbi:Phosphomannomutase 2 [Araneus ventricosus]|uniref:Phosphomannomutase n=1 Tax=Araneus ventricosus TaxID=182803 RepID=A0A4Y2DXI2_ARAVE|nr:Phosphomannomutase 2 [Araneus ventricosus]